jgi:hypothetical protein
VSVFIANPSTGWRIHAHPRYPKRKAGNPKALAGWFSGLDRAIDNYTLLRLQGGSSRLFPRRRDVNKVPLTRHNQVTISTTGKHVRGARPRTADAEGIRFVILDVGPSAADVAIRPEEVVEVVVAPTCP